MNWITNLLGVKAPENTTLESAELGFRGLLTPWLLIPVVLLIVAGVFFLYFQERGRLGPVRRSLLAVLRVAVLVLLLGSAVSKFLARSALLAAVNAQWPAARLIAGGVRLLAIEFLPWHDRQKTAVALSAAFAFVVGLAFLLNLFG